jgi:hypothetical protein
MTMILLKGYMKHVVLILKVFRNQQYFRPTIQYSLKWHLYIIIYCILQELENKLKKKANSINKMTKY